MRCVMTRGRQVRILIVALLIVSSTLVTSAEAGFFHRIFRHRRCKQSSRPPAAYFEVGATTRIADPKLSGAAVQFSFRLLPDYYTCDAVVEVLQGSVVVDELWSGSVQGGDPVDVVWDGKDSAAHYVNTGDYSIRVRGTGPCPPPLESPVSIVRLGITEIAAL